MEQELPELHELNAPLWLEVLPSLLELEVLQSPLVLEVQQSLLGLEMLQQGIPELPESCGAQVHESQGEGTQKPQEVNAL